MTRPARIAIAALSVVCAGLVAVVVWLIYSGPDLGEMEARDAKLRAEIATLDVETARLQDELHAEKRSSALAWSEAAKHASVSAERKRRLAKLSQIPPVAHPYVKRRDDVIESQDTELDLTKESRRAAWAAVEKCEAALGKCQQAKGIEHVRAGEWKSFSKKQRRRYRINLAFTAIGSAAAGGVAGYLAADATRCNRRPEEC